MFTTENQIPNPDLTDPIERLLAQLDGFAGESEEYATIIKQLEKLYALRELDKPKRINPDTLVTVGANLAGIILILNYERVNVVSSKALGFVMKLR